jgi:GMP synthase-like glutamine amidotransferase
MATLILKNIEKEGPGTIEGFLTKNNIGYSIIELTNEPLILDRDYDVLIIMGGPMSVHDKKIYPYLSLEEALIRDFIDNKKRVLGVCLGAQLIASALGEDVYKGAKPEIGWDKITVTDDGLNDPVFSKLVDADNPMVTVFQWHSETFNIPYGARRLAFSELYRNQAFKYGDNSYAFQFHIEADENIIFEWMKDEPIDHNSLKKATEKNIKEYRKRAERFYEGFFA